MNLNSYTLFWISKDFGGFSPVGAMEYATKQEADLALEILPDVYPHFVFWIEKR
jgi:hypothetical protein